jgi:hypothetical protein
MMLFRYFDVRCSVSCDNLPSRGSQANGLGIRDQLIGCDRMWRPVTHCLHRFAQESVCRARVAAIQQHEVDQSTLLVDGAEQVLPLSSDFYIGFVHPPRNSSGSPDTSECASRTQARSAAPHRTQTRMISTGKRRRLNTDICGAPRLAFHHTRPRLMQQSRFTRRNHSAQVKSISPAISWLVI